MTTARPYSPNTGHYDASDGTLRWGLIVRKTLRQENITVGTSAVALPTAALADRINILIVNNSTSGQILYIGDATVSSTNGIPIYPRQSYLLSIEDGVSVYGISSASGADIRVLEGC